MSKRRAANTVNRMEIFQKKRNLSVPKTKIDSIIVLVKATRSLTLENEMTGATAIRRPHWRKENQCVMNCLSSTLSQENHPENHKAEGAHRARRNGSASNPTEPVQWAQIGSDAIVMRL